MFKKKCKNYLSEIASWDSEISRVIKITYLCYCICMGDYIIVNEYKIKMYS